MSRQRDQLREEHEWNSIKLREQEELNQRFLMRSASSYAQQPRKENISGNQKSDSPARNHLRYKPDIKNDFELRSKIQNGVLTTERSRSRQLLTEPDVEKKERMTFGQASNDYDIVDSEYKQSTLRMTGTASDVLAEARDLIKSRKNAFMPSQMPAEM